MEQVNLNSNLVDVFEKHGVSVTQDEEFIYPDLPIKIKLKAWATPTELNGRISSRLDVMIVTPAGETIYEAFGDVAFNLDDALSKNLTNFCTCILHTLMAAFGSTDEHVIHHVNIEEWVVNGISWKAYISNLNFKAIGSLNDHSAATYFYDVLEQKIKSMPLTNNRHWFRGFYSQYRGILNTGEFLVDNVLFAELDNEIFLSIPIIDGIEFYSCRLFVILKQIGNSNSRTLAATQAGAINSPRRLFKLKLFFKNLSDISALINRLVFI